MWYILITCVTGPYWKNGNIGCNSVKAQVRHETWVRLEVYSVCQFSNWVTFCLISFTLIQCYTAYTTKILLLQLCQINKKMGINNRKKSNPHINISRDMATEPVYPNPFLPPPLHSTSLEYWVLPSEIVLNPCLVQWIYKYFGLGY